MNRKAKGTNAERELLHMFWSKGWACIRSAGSGSMRYASPDLMVGNANRRLVIEVKTTKDDKKYFTKQEIIELKRFSEIFGAEPWVAVKFPKTPWRFLMLEDLDEKGVSFMVSVQLAERRGLSFDNTIEI